MSLICDGVLEDESPCNGSFEETDKFCKACGKRKDKVRKTLGKMLHERPQRRERVYYTVVHEGIDCTGDNSRKSKLKKEVSKSQEGDEKPSACVTGSANVEGRALCGLFSGRQNSDGEDSDEELIALRNELKCVQDEEKLLKKEKEKEELRRKIFEKRKQLDELKAEMSAAKLRQEVLEVILLNEPKAVHHAFDVHKDAGADNSRDITPGQVSERCYGENKEENAKKQDVRKESAGKGNTVASNLPKCECV